MGILDNFEKGLERAVNGAFAKTFRSGIQPVELTSALRKELDTKAAIVTRDRILAPNRFTIDLAPADYQRMLSIGPALVDELTQFVAAHAKKQHYQFAGGISVELTEDPGLSVGMLDVESENVKSDVSWAPVLDVGSKRHPLTKPRTVVGRGSEADITVDDTGISRRHFQILWDGQHAQLEDLGSTNGTQLNGEKSGRALLPPESIIKAGRTSMVFRVLPQSTSVQPYETHREENVTRVNDLRDLEALFGDAPVRPSAPAVGEPWDVPPAAAPAAAAAWPPASPAPQSTPAAESVWPPAAPLPSSEPAAFSFAAEPSEPAAAAEADEPVFPFSDEPEPDPTPESTAAPAAERAPFWQAPAAPSEPAAQPQPAAPPRAAPRSQPPGYTPPATAAPSAQPSRTAPPVSAQPALSPQAAPRPVQFPPVQPIPAQSAPPQPAATPAPRAAARPAAQVAPQPTAQAQPRPAVRPAAPSAPEERPASHEKPSRAKPSRERRPFWSRALDRRAADNADDEPARGPDEGDAPLSDFWTRR